MLKNYAGQCWEVSEGKIAAFLADYVGWFAYHNHPIPSETSDLYLIYAKLIALEQLSRCCPPHFTTLDVLANHATVTEQHSPVASKVRACLMQWKRSTSDRPEPEPHWAFHQPGDSSAVMATALRELESIGEISSDQMGMGKTVYRLSERGCHGAYADKLKEQACELMFAVEAEYKRHMWHTK